ncbi:hypothetical protein BDW02DRAFT_56675 [Decorospora gaudefroyi]|uniref:BTB domain-containing protein n=1 Tax=Decorospora gaudefroyi TaxID=184978 RepID=A0A6A5K2F9_9PLEO|nr:hypothetical protein BDW02DRAFT_56675 [Decorospora gaudefroyi]
MAEPARDILVSALKHLLISGDHSDFVITCGSDTHNVHKAIVCARSKFLKAAERFPVQEAAGAKVDLSEDEPAIVKLAIQYFYEADYEPKLADSQKAFVPFYTAETTPVVRMPKFNSYHYIFPHTCEEHCIIPNICPHHTCYMGECRVDCVDFVCKLCCPRWDLPVEPEPAETIELLLHAKMYEIADKYDVDGLKELAREKFTWACSVYWDSQHFATAAHHAYSTTPDEDKGLREIVSKTLFEHMDLIDKPEVDALLNKFNGLAVGLLKMQMKK